VLADPPPEGEAVAAALALRKTADELGARRRGLAGRQLGLTPR
jgi:hypothetical protein